MDLNNTAKVTVGTYLKEWWEELPGARKRIIRRGIAFFVTFWMAGAVYAPSAVAGLARVEIGLRFILSVCMGGFSFLWRVLEISGAIQETAEKPNLLWVPLSLLLPGFLFLFLYILSQPPNPLFGIQKMLGKASRSQGRVEVESLKEKLAMQQGVPLVQLVDGKEKKLLGLDYQKSEGHAIVVAPTRAGKGLHLTDTLRHYPGPVLVIDPKGEQYQRTAALRRQLGPVYRLPGHQVHLSAYYRHLRDRDDAIELHHHLLRPWASSEPIFAEKALSLFTAIGPYAQVLQLNPIRLLLDLAESNPIAALTALRTVPLARRHVDIFTNGAAPAAYKDDRFVTSALGNFTTRLAPYQKHIDTIAPPDLNRRDLIVPPDWANQNSTIYITYSLTELRAVGGVVSAIIAAILRYQMRLAQSATQKQKMLVAIDELPAVGLRNVVDYLSTVGGYGITMLLYVQSVAQLQELYGREGLRSILANCNHQLWYPAADMETAKFMSELFGTTLKAQPMQSASQSARQQPDAEGKIKMQMSNNQGASWSWREAAALSPNEMMALPNGQVLATTLVDQRYTFLGERVSSIALFNRLPPPTNLHLPQPIIRERDYTNWPSAPTPGTNPTMTVNTSPQPSEDKDGTETAAEQRTSDGHGDEQAAEPPATQEPQAKPNLSRIVRIIR